MRLVVVTAVLLLLVAETVCFHEPFGLRTKRFGWNPSSSLLHCIGDAAKSSGVTAVDTGQSAPGSTASVKTTGSGSRVYTPRNDRAVTTVDGGPRVYNVRSSGTGGARYGSGPANPRGDRREGSGGPSFLLKAPLLLVRYKVPRDKSAFKVQLEELQEQYQDASERSRGWGGGGGGYGGGGGSDAFMDKMSNGGPAFGADKRPIKKGGGDGQRKGSEGARPDGPGRQDRRGKGGQEDDDEEYYDEQEGEDRVFEGEGDYYGDDLQVSLSSVPSGALRTMIAEGYTFEEMQMELYGEYGVKASILAIRRRLNDDRQQGGRRKKKTGKTRKDRNKRRDLRRNPQHVARIRIPTEPIQIQDLAEMIDVGGAEVVKYLMMNMGIMSSLTQSVAPSVAREVVVGFGKEIAGEGGEDNDDEDDDEYDDEDDGDDDFEDDGEGAGVVERLVYDTQEYEQLERAPVVTIMGHVDHGKTSLLDVIRKANVAAGEAGGITQGVSAFKVRTDDDKYVTFIDTPGHAAFSDMRKRGANVTDIIVLVVAADDGIMEQTKECIVAAKTAGCPIVIAINKIDKEGADPTRIMTDLTKYDIVTEDLGGDVQCVQVSAKNEIGISVLLDKLLLQAEVMNLKAPVDCLAEGSVIEASVNKRLGTTVTALVRKGTLRKGDYVLAGPAWGRVRRLRDDQGYEIDEAGPGTPVEVVGLNVVPNAGDAFMVTKDEAGAREVAEARQRLQRQSVGQSANSAIMAQAAGFAGGSFDAREIIKVPFLIKGDVSGSVEALRASIDALTMSDDEAICKADIVYAGVGDVTSSDVAIAQTARAKVLAFNVAAANNAMDDARQNNVEIGYYSVVYDLLDELKEQIEVTLAPPPPGRLVGRATIQKVFRLGKIGKVAGCTVSEGILKGDSKVRIMRGKRNAVYSGSLSSLKVVKETVEEVPTDSECGCSFEDFQDFEEGDIIECFVGGNEEEEV